jgi:outer membrane biosynthesis protein TonB
MAEKAKRAEPTRPPSPAVAKNSLPEPQPVPRGPRSTDRLPDRIAESLPKPVATPVPEKSEPVPAPVPPSPVVPATATSQPKVETSFAIPPRVTETDPAKKNTDVPSAARTIPPSPETSVFGHRVVAGKYGHAPDYTWLQGEADKHYRGYWTLRYRDPSEEDKYGGRVKLEGAIRLTEFEVGDIIGVRGEFVPNANPNQPPSFKVHNLWLVNKKQ